MKTKDGYGSYAGPVEESWQIGSFQVVVKRRVLCLDTDHIAEVWSAGERLEREVFTSREKALEAALSMLERAQNS